MSDAGDISLGWESVKSLCGKMIQAVTGFVGIFIFTRLVDKAEFGGFYLLFALVMLGNRPIGGFYTAVEKRWSEADSPQAQILGAVFIVNVFALVLAGVLVFLARDYLIAYTELDGAPLLFLALFGALIFFLPLQSILSAAGWPSKKVWNDTLRSIITLPLQLLLVFSGMGALGMGYGLTGATLLVAPVPLYFVRQRPTLPNKATLHSLWSYTRFSSVENLVGKAYNRIDILMLGFFIGGTAVANYEVALKLTLPATFVSGVVGNALRPKISNADSKGESFAVDVRNAAGYVSILAIPIFFGALALSRPIVVTAFEARYATAAPYLIGLALYQIFSGQSAIYRRTIAGMDLPHINLKVSTVTLAFNIVVGVGLVVTIGPLGIVLASILAEALQYSLAMAMVVQQVDDLQPLPQPLVMQAVAGAVMYFVVELAEAQIAIQSWVDLGVLVGLGAIIYGVVLVVIEPEVRTTARSIYQDATA